MSNLQWDLAFVVSNDDVGIANVRKDLDFHLFPNPVVSADRRISITTQVEKAATAQVTLFDMAGKVLKVITVEDL